MTNLTEILNRVRSIDSEVRAIAEVVPEVDDEVHRRFGHSLLDIRDMLSSVRWELEARTDGRPAPFDISDGEYKGDSFDITRFCECFGHEEKKQAIVGGHELTLQQLISIRDWLNVVIEFHSQGPSNGN